MGDGDYELKCDCITAKQQIRQRELHEHYIFSLTALDVYDLFSRGLMKIDVWNVDKSMKDRPKERGGYQRAANLRRIQSFSNYISGEWPNEEIDGFGLSPTAVVLFLRDKKNVGVSDKKNKLVIKLNKDNPIYIPDGQHRLGGMSWAIKREFGLKYEDPMKVFDPKSE